MGGAGLRGVALFYVMYCRGGCEWYSMVCTWYVEEVGMVDSVVFIVQYLYVLY
jgi:hypothetical protein